MKQSELPQEARAYAAAGKEKARGNARSKLATRREPDVTKIGCRSEVIHTSVYVTDLV